MFWCSVSGAACAKTIQADTHEDHVPWNQLTWHQWHCCRHRIEGLEGTEALGRQRHAVAWCDIMWHLVTSLISQPRFPEYDRAAWAKGDSRTAARDVSLDKHVSQDLESLAPEVVELISRLTMSLNTVNNLMLNQLDTGDSNFDVACRWLKENEASWSSWLPERGKCFSQFGMYSDACHIFFSRNGLGRLGCCGMIYRTYL